MKLAARHRHYNEYRRDDGQIQLDLGGGIHNVIPFDEGGDVLVPGHYRAAANPSEVYRLRSGEMGFEIHRLTGEIRVCPIRGRWDIYYSIAPTVPRALSYRQIHDGLLELFVNTPKVRYSFFISDLGFKVNIRLKENQGDTFSHSFNVAMQGLTRQGRKVMYQGNEVGMLPNPFYTDASGDGEVYGVREVLQGGQVTLTATGLVSKTYPIDIDPTFGPSISTKDNFIRESTPTTNRGGDSLLVVAYLTNFLNVILIDTDFSATPMGSVISATMELYYFGKFGDAVGETLSFDRNKRPDWVELQSTWQIYKTGSNWQTAGAMGANDRDTANRTSALIPAAFSWVPWNILDHAQDALDNRGSVISLASFNTTGGVNNQARFYPREEAVFTALRPRFTIVGTDIVTANIPPYAFKRAR